MLPDKFKLKGEILEQLIKAGYDTNICVDGYEDYYADAETQEGRFDFEKSAAYDFPITIYHKECDDYWWRGNGGWYNRYGIFSFNYEIEFIKCSIKEKIVAVEDKTSESELKAFSAGYDQCIEDIAKKNDEEGYDRLKKIKVYYSIQDGHDGSVFLYWYLTESEAINNVSEGFFDGYGSVETFEGSDIHKLAIK